MSEAPVPLILDTDIGDDIDDLYALYLALFHPRLQLRAVTTVHGDTQAKARLVHKALRMAGRMDIPVGAGIPMSQARLARGQTLPDPWRNATYLDYVTADDPEAAMTFPPARQIITEALTQSPQPLAIVGIGALSNIAETVMGPSNALRDNIRCLAIMGGETSAIHTEYNILCDPEAAEIVLNCGLPVFMGTFFLTARLSLSMADVDQHFSADHPIYRTLRECTTLWGPGRGHKSGPVLYDLVPVFWLADESNVQTRRSTIHVELQGTWTRALTIRVADDGPVLEAVDLDAPALIQELLHTLHPAPAAVLPLPSREGTGG